LEEDDKTINIITNLQNDLDELKSQPFARQVQKTSLNIVNKAAPTTQAGIVQDQLKEQIKLDLIDEMRENIVKLIDFKMKDFKELSNKKEDFHFVEELKEDIKENKNVIMRLNTHKEQIDKNFQELHLNYGKMEKNITEVIATLELKSNIKELAALSDRLKNFPLKLELDNIKQSLGLYAKIDETGKLNIKIQETDKKFKNYLLKETFEKDLEISVNKI